MAGFLRINTYNVELLIKFKSIILQIYRRYKSASFSTYNPLKTEHPKRVIFCNITPLSSIGHIPLKLVTYLIENALIFDHPKRVL